MSKLMQRCGLLLSCLAILGMVSVLSGGSDDVNWLWCWPGTNCTGTI